MGKTSRNGGASDRASGQTEDATDVIGLQNFTTEPSIGDISLRSYMAMLDRALAPSGVLIENAPRSSSVLSTLTVLTSGTLRLVHLPLIAGQTVTSLALTAIGAAVTPTNQWFGLLDSGRRALAFTTDDGSTAWGANTRKSLNLTTPWVVQYTGLHYVAILVAAGTTPTLAGVSSTSIVTGQAPSLSGNTSDTGLTTVPALPFTAGAITASGLMPYVAAS